MDPRARRRLERCGRKSNRAVASDYHRARSGAFHRPQYRAEIAWVRHAVDHQQRIGMLSQYRLEWRVLVFADYRDYSLMMRPRTRHPIEPLFLDAHDLRAACANRLDLRGESSLGASSHVKHAHRGGRRRDKVPQRCDAGDKPPLRALMSVTRGRAPTPLRPTRIQLSPLT